MRSQKTFHSLLPPPISPLPTAARFVLEKPLWFKNEWLSKVGSLVTRIFYSRPTLSSFLCFIIVLCSVDCVNRGSITSAYIMFAHLVDMKERYIVYFLTIIWWLCATILYRKKLTESHSTEMFILQISVKEYSSRVFFDLVQTNRVYFLRVK